MFRHSTGRSTTLAAFALVAVIVAGCSTAAAPTPTPYGPGPSNVPTTQPNPTAADQVPSAPTAAPTTGLPSNLSFAVGKAPLAAPADDRGQAAATQLNDFGFDLLRGLDSKGNLVVSPASIALALGMVRSGAKGQTAAEMDKVLHGFGAGSPGEMVALMQAYASQTRYIDADGVPIPTDKRATTEPLVELDVADQAFVQRDLNVVPAYLDTLHSGYNAGVALVDYKTASEAARKLVNGWASAQTKGRIPEILQQGDVDDTTRLVLVNAIYLKAAWEDPFNAKMTTDKPFATAGGTKNVPTMATDLHLDYGAGDGYQSVTLPYAMNGLAMTIVVPNDMAAFVKNLTAAQLDAIAGSERAYEVDLTLPKWSNESRIELAAVLSAMGMPTAFDPNGADFSGITTDKPGLFVSKVIHQANIDVVEQGTTAAAVTAVAMSAGAAPGQPKKVTFHVDKPFLYFIRDNVSGSVLFMGRVNDPTAKQ